MHTDRTRTATHALVASLCFLATVTACESHTNPAGGAALAPAASAPSGRLTTATLRDPSFNDMPATRVTVPSGWRVQGQMALGACVNMPAANWNATSPDGQSQFHVLPVLGWRWGNGVQGGGGCIPLTEPLHAADFLERFAARIRGLRIVGPMPVSEPFRRQEVNFTAGADANDARLAAQFARMARRYPRFAIPEYRMRNLGDVAAVRAMDSSGHELRLRAWVQCQQSARFGGNCFAKVDVVQAPKGRLDALVSLIDSHNLVQDHPTHEYFAARMAALRNQNREIGKRQLAGLSQREAAQSQMLRSQYETSTATLNANHNAFERQMGAQQRSHDAFLNQMSSSTRSSMNNANAAMNARSTAASDMQDYSLNQQTMSGANGTYKTSSQYSNVWSSPNAASRSNRSTFGSTDNTANPNSATDNTWTKDKKVHGNGQPW